jgi:hypothetical protein
MKNKLHVLIFIFLALLLVVGSRYKEGAKNKKKAKAKAKPKAKPKAEPKAKGSATKPKAVNSKTDLENSQPFEKDLNVGNDGEDYDMDPMPFAKKNPIQVCKDACLKMAGCVGFITDKENDLCVFKAKKGNAVNNTNLTSFWKKN